MKLSELAKVVKERELSHGSETPLLGMFVSEFGRIDEAIRSNKEVGSVDYVYWDTMYGLYEKMADKGKNVDMDTIIFAASMEAIGADL